MRSIEGLAKAIFLTREQRFFLAREDEQLKKRAEVFHAQLNYHINQSTKSGNFTHEELGALSKDPQQVILFEQIGSVSSEEAARTIWNSLSSAQQTDFLLRERSRLEKDFKIPSGGNST